MPVFIIRKGAKKAQYLLTQRNHLVGIDPHHEISLGKHWKAEKSSNEVGPNAYFSIQLEEPPTSDQRKAELIPLFAPKVLVNGVRVNRPTPLFTCDRVEWEDYVATYVDTALVSDESKSSQFSLERFHALLEKLQEVDGPKEALVELLRVIVTLSGAEEGYLLTEDSASGSWSMYAVSHHPDKSEYSEKPNRKAIYSNTILQEVCRKREPVYIENMIGHPLSEAMSVMEARLFSVAALPLIVGGKLFGVVMLHTHSPGVRIQSENLKELMLLGAQVALLILNDREKNRLEEVNRGLRTLVGKTQKDPSASSFISHSALMKEIIAKIEKIARSQLPLLLQGETGTGKEVAAKEVHRLSDRASKPFVSLNCAAIPEALLESMLFGHIKGAFTGATQNQIGKMVQANGGTLFLDEIGDLSPALQAKILRVIQDKRVEPLGAREAIQVDFRLISATHRDLKQLCARNEFRQDLYFRIAGATLALPALRERPDDIIPLAEIFVQKTGLAKKFSDEAKHTLLRYTWPGNVRELEQVVARAVVFSESEVIQAKDLELLSFHPAQESMAENDSFWQGFDSLDKAQRDFTQGLVKKALEKFDGNRAKTADRLGISERTLYRILSDPAI